MVKADKSWPRPQHVAWQSPYLNRFSMLPKPSLLGLPAYLNSSTCIFPAVNTFPGLASPARPSLKTDPINEVQGSLQYPNAATSLAETNIGRALQNVNPASSQKKLLVFDHSGNKTRFFYGPVHSLVHSPTVTTTKFAQNYDVNGEGLATNIGKKYLAKYGLPEKSVKDFIVIEESEKHEDTEEINALLYSDDDNDDEEDDDNCDEVMSTDRSPLLMQEQLEDAKEEVASSDWPNKRLKLIDGVCNRSSPPVDGVSLVRPTETCECVSDAESKNSSGREYSVEKTKFDNLMVGDIRLKKDKLRESLSVLENLIPGAKGKEPLSVIEGTIQYLKFLMSQTGTLGVKYQ